MAEIVEVVKKKMPVESLTVKLTRNEVFEIIGGLDAARNGHRFYFDIQGGRSKIAKAFEQALDTSNSFTLPRYQDTVSRVLKDLYADVKI